MNAISLPRHASPLEAGYVMPAEWHPHERCWMAWPDRADLWGPALRDTQTSYAAVAKAIRAFEPVTMVANPVSARLARDLCGTKIDVVEIPIDDAWARDMGPSFVRSDDGRLAGTAWRFNAWGGKSPQYRLDAAFGERVTTLAGAPTYHSSLCVEGGAIHVDGEGTVITTESVVLNKNRNPGISKAQAEAALCHGLGASKVIWLPGDLNGITSDVTDGHIDGLVSFVSPGVVLYETDPSASGVYKQMMHDNFTALKTATDAQGRKLEIIVLEDANEAPTEHEVFCRSYVNFYIANGGIVMPSYGIAADDRAREVLSTAYPDRTIVQVDVNLIAPGGGGIHCITQQQPRNS